MRNVSQSRRNVLLQMAGVAVAPALAALPETAKAAYAAPPTATGFRETRISRLGHSIYVRDYPGTGPAFVMIHGFPDNSRIYEEVATRLSRAGRRVVAFDFLGFGQSDKPTAFEYSFEQQLGDLSTVVDHLRLDDFIPVGHDAGGPAAINYALNNPNRIHSLALFNSYYSNTPSRAFPDFIELCSNPKTKLLARAMMTDPAQAQYLFNFQQGLLRANLTPEMRERWDTVLQPIIAHNFTQTPSAMPAMLAMTGDAYANLDANDKRIPELQAFERPVRLIWGGRDKYLSVALAKEIAAPFQDAKLDVLDAEHWPQFDQPDQAASLLLRA